MSIQSEINRLKQNISASFTAVGEKGGTVPVSKVSGNLAAAIRSIPEGVELNFEVVGGTSAPTDPKENTIWVNTGTNIKSWTIGTANPYLEKVHLMNSSVELEGGYLGVSLGSPYLSLNANWDCTKQISLPDNTVAVTITSNDTDDEDSVCHVFYDENGSYHSHVLRNEHDGTGTFPVPTGAKYMRASFHITDTRCVIAAVNNAVSGDLWITADTISNVGEFNALETNGIHVYPLTAKQYINGKWTKKTTKIWQNGEWVDCVTRIYTNGKTAHSIMPMAIKATATSSNAAVKPRTGINQTNFWAMVQKSDSGGAAGLVYLTPKLDLTKVSTLYVNGTFSSGNNGAFPYIGVWSKFGEHSGEYRSAMKAACTAANSEFTGTVAVDVSALSGEYYMGFYMSTTTNACSVSVKDIYYD